MKLQNFGTFSLNARLAMIRLGLANIVAGLLCLTGVIGWLVVTPYLARQSAIQEYELAKAQQFLAIATHTPTSIQSNTGELRLTTFYGVLGEKRQVESYLKLLFKFAAEAGITLNQAEYKFASNMPGKFHTYQIHLPVKGTYFAIRRFCENTLVAIPFASLDEMTFKRDEISNGTGVAKLRITFFLRPDDDEISNENNTINARVSP